MFILQAISLALFSQLFYLSSQILPLHDTLQNFQSFFFFFNSLHFDGEIPFWVPYGTYGVSNDINLWATVPSIGWLLLLGGAAAGISDVMLLYKLSLMLEVMVYVFGMALVAQRLFGSVLARWVVVLAATGAVVWVRQPFMNLQVFYLLPLIIHALLRFRDEESPRWLWLAALLGLVSMHGSLHYIAFISILVVTLFLVPIVLEKPKLLMVLLKPDRVTWLLIALTLAMMAIEGYFLLHNLDGVFISEERASDTGLVTLENFLHYGRQSFGGYLVAIITGAYPLNDFIYYFGLLPLLLFIAGLFFIRDTIFWSCALGAIALVWLSVAGYFATGLYYLWPGMNMVRHIGGYSGLAMVLMVIGSGFVLEHIHHGLTRGFNPPKPSRFGPFPQWLLAILLLGTLALDVAMHDGRGGLIKLFNTQMLNDPNWKSFFLARMALYEIGLLLFIIWRLLPMQTSSQDRGKRGRKLAFILLLIFLGDMGSYRLQTHMAATLYEPGAGASLYQSTPTPYIPSRQKTPQMGSRAEASMAMATRELAFHNVQYAMSLYPFAHFDPCFPQMVKTKIQIMDQPVERMLAALFDDQFFPDLGVQSSHTQRYYTKNYRPDIVRSLGCESDKLLLLRTARLARNDTEARALFKQSKALDRMVIVTDPPPSLQALFDGDARVKPGDDLQLKEEMAVENPGRDVEGTIKVTRFSANRLDAQVTNNDGQPLWLLYRDGYHPHWKAWLNDQEIPIARANIGFKTVRIPPGNHRLRLQFEHGMMGQAGHLLIGLSALAGLLLIGVMLGVAFVQARRGSITR
ncbi:MAG: hypothetical protein HQL53_04040 [Magnetococcales bacterium]|nr:hypothetical protein [Magnetococcales bacterium]